MRRKTVPSLNRKTGPGQKVAQGGIYPPMSAKAGGSIWHMRRISWAAWAALSSSIFLNGLRPSLDTLLALPEDMTRGQFSLLEEIWRRGEDGYEDLAV